MKGWSLGSTSLKMMRPMVVSMQLAGLVLVVHAVRDLATLRVVLQTHLDLGLQVNVRTGVIGVLRVLEVDEHAPLAREPIAGGREVVHADDHVLRRDGERAGRVPAT